MAEIEGTALVRWLVFFSLFLLTSLRSDGGLALETPALQSSCGGNLNLISSLDTKFACFLHCLTLLIFTSPSLPNPLYSSISSSRVFPVHSPTYILVLPFLSHSFSLSFFPFCSLFPSHFTSTTRLRYQLKYSWSLLSVQLFSTPIT